MQIFYLNDKDSDVLPNLQEWLVYFQNNALEHDVIPWMLKETLTVQERECISRSIATFQLGEYSEGRGMMKFARQYAVSQDSPVLVEITRLFIREEQNHALLLKRFMEQHEIPVLEQEWTDSVFRRLRKLAGYELSIMVLITAEIISLTYYKALRCCTDSRVLQAICEKLLRDEVAHVEYESSLLNYIRAEHSTVWRGIVRLFHSVLFCGTVVVVYFLHSLVLRRGGYSFRRFWQSCRADFVRLFDTAGQVANVPSQEIDC